MTVITGGPKGFKCGCGQWHEFAIWVYAHWSDVLVHKCDGCGRRHEIIRGKAIEVKGPDKRRRKK